MTDQPKRPQGRRRPKPTDPREAAWDEAVACFAEGYRLLDTLPLKEAARRAWTPTGPPIAELEARIRARRVELGIDQPES